MYLIAIEKLLPEESKKLVKYCNCRYHRLYFPFRWLALVWRAFNVDHVEAIDNFYCLLTDPKLYITDYGLTTYQHYVDLAKEKLLQETNATHGTNV